MSSKAGRNEARKLTANALNNMGVAAMLAALLQPVLLFVQQDRAPTLATGLTSLILLCVGFALFGGARRVVQALED
jgi:predicted PurR-regulated permease PerM